MTTIGHILQNPKYKGWFCGNKTQSLDYRKKKTAFLDESEWIMYPDPNIPAIVSEKIWDKANAIFKQRSARTKAYGVGYQSRYPYSGKIICEKHGTTFHRQSFKTKAGETEFWKCRTYREKGKAGCDIPSMRTKELDAVLSDLFQKLITNQKEIIQLVLRSIFENERKVDYSVQIGSLNEQIEQLTAKKEKLLELSIVDAITLQEFKVRNNRLNEQISDMEGQLKWFKQREGEEKFTQVDSKVLEKALWEELCFENGGHSEVTASILEKVIVCEGSDKKVIHLEIHLRLGQTVSADFLRGPFVFCESSLRNTTARRGIRMI
jgi:hypothetical protein